MQYSIRPLLNQKLAILTLLTLVPVLLAQPVAQSSIQSRSDSKTAGISSASSAQGTAPSPAETSLPAPDQQPGQTHLQSQAPSSQEVSCPAGQFASAFPDVKPTDWAYEAVNRLAATPIRCFPSTQSR